MGKCVGYMLQVPDVKQEHFRHIKHDMFEMKTDASVFLLPHMNYDDAADQLWNEFNLAIYNQKSLL